MVRQGHLIAVVGTFLIGCAVLLIVVGCAGVGRKPQQKEQTLTPSYRVRTSPMRGDEELPHLPGPP